jgi:hypothetical protein
MTSPTCASSARPDVSDDSGGMEVARVTITRRLSDDDTAGDLIFAETDPPDLALIESIGMLRLAEGLLIEHAWHPDDEDDD